MDAFMDQHDDGAAGWNIPPVDEDRLWGNDPAIADRGRAAAPGTLRSLHRRTERIE